ncbi:uncharacterized protein LOC116619495 isoform X2 [Nematostella vectensis]|uniref:uncharacterized protein LOC116619495 isoform X2 n=1 Tax=Nematostella vectensis TaxID=45351 RepID=UPI0020774B23|nr:uncharacterized protein LOC116619495 isoform X2 [Nematostella vectensis]
MSSNTLVYICGDFASEKADDEHLKALVLSSVATHFCTRSHPNVRSIDSHFDKAELYHTITRCYAFIFIFSKETIDDTFYLNQYGIAKAYGVPIIGVREPSYFMPNPLPEQFYFTEIVDYTGENRDGKSNRILHGPVKAHPSLAEALLQDFKMAMVYAAEFHRSCAPRLLHKVNQACTRSENEKQFYAELTRSQQQHNVSVAPIEIAPKNNSPATAHKCPKCGLNLNKHQAKPSPLIRASSTGSLLRKSDAFDIDHFKPYKKTALQPTTISIPALQYVRANTAERRTRSPIQTVTTWAPQKKTTPHKPIEPFRGKLQTRHSHLYGENENRDEGNKPSQENLTEKILLGKGNDSKVAEMPSKSRTIRKQSRVSNTSWSEKLRLKLRRQSSLPVIPTTYLVTSPSGKEKQLSFVKYPPEKSGNTPRNSLLPVFSEDEEQETIHISRAPSPDTSSCRKRQRS